MARSTKGFTLIEIMIVVAILGIVIAIAMPSFLRARENSRSTACQENLNKIDSAKQQWAMEQPSSDSVAPGFGDLVGDQLYLRRVPVCPAGGVYAINPPSESPTCDYAPALNFGFDHALSGSVGSGS